MRFIWAFVDIEKQGIYNSAQIGTRRPARENSGQSRNSGQSENPGQTENLGQSKILTRERINERA